MRHAAVFAALLATIACSGSTAKKSSVGAACTPQASGQSDECTDGLCLALGDQASGVCSKDCSADHVCPEGFSCDLAGRFGFVCQRSRGCTADPDCPAGHVCDVATSTCYIKVSRSLCSPCEDDLQCPEGGSCFTALGSNERFCTTACDASGACPAGYACQDLPDGKANQCVPVTQSCSFGKPICAPCKGDNECGNALDLCVRNVVSGEQFCGKQCAPDRPADCATGFSCTNLQQNTNGPGPFQCVPNSNTCVGYCDSADEHVQTIECGLGRTCDLANAQCTAALDGRECSPCQTNDDCQKLGHASNQCVVNTSINSGHQGESFCAEPCPAGPTGTGICIDRLGPGFSCEPVGNESFCVPVRGTCLTGLGRLGDSCAANGPDDCVTGTCLVAGNGSVCSATCGADVDCGDSRFRCCTLVVPADPSQPTTYDCSQRNGTDDGPQNGAGICAPNGGSFGDDCSPGRPPCTSGACLDLGTAQICTSTCDSSACPEGFVCQAAADAISGEASQVCFPVGGGVVGSDCTFGPAACSDRLCIKKDSGNVCTKICDSTADCPSDYSCEPQSVVGETAQFKVCMPPSLQ